jgi:hypothetical protein
MTPGKIDSCGVFGQSKDTWRGESVAKAVRYPISTAKGARVRRQICLKDICGRGERQESRLSLRVTMPKDRDRPQNLHIREAASTLEKFENGGWSGITLYSRVHPNKLDQKL